MKKFSELNKINEATYINQKLEVNFLLNTLGLNIEDLEDIFIDFLDKADHDFGINLYYKHHGLYYTMLNYEDFERLSEDGKISNVTLTIFFQSKSYNNKGYYSESTKKRGIYSISEINLIEEYILALKRLISIIKYDKITYNTELEQLNINLEFGNSDEILNVLKEIVKNKYIK